MNEKNDKGWNPYLAGGLSGLLIVFSVLLTGKYFGASSSFVRTAGMIEKLFCAERVAGMDYYFIFEPAVDWQWMFVLGILIGSFTSAITSGSFKLKAVPDMWKGRFGSSKAKRFIVAFAGGVIAMFGARISDG